MAPPPPASASAALSAILARLRQRISSLHQEQPQAQQQRRRTRPRHNSNNNNNHPKYFKTLAQQLLILLLPFLLGMSLALPLAQWMAAVKSPSHASTTRTRTTVGLTKDSHQDHVMTQVLTETASSSSNHDKDETYSYYEYLLEQQQQYQQNDGVPLAWYH